MVHGLSSANSGSSRLHVSASRSDGLRQTVQVLGSLQHKTAEQRNPLLALCNPPQSHQIISAERYMTNTQEGWRKRKEDGQRHRGMKELYNRITERSFMWPMARHLIRHASRRRMLGLTQHPTRTPTTCVLCIGTVWDTRAESPMWGGKAPKTSQNPVLCGHLKSAWAVLYYRRLSHCSNNDR